MTISYIAISLSIIAIVIAAFILIRNMRVGQHLPPPPVETLSLHDSAD